MQHDMVRAISGRASLMELLFLKPCDFDCVPETLSCTHVMLLQVLFATDVLAEAEAAQAAGWKAVLVNRPGNKPLPGSHSFRVIESITQLLQQ